MFSETQKLSKDDKTTTVDVVEEKQDDQPQQSCTTENSCTINSKSTETETCTDNNKSAVTETSPNKSDIIKTKEDTNPSGESSENFTKVNILLFLGILDKFVPWMTQPRKIFFLSHERPLYIIVGI